jgi:hypothetical protein
VERFEEGLHIVRCKDRDCQFILTYASFLISPLLVSGRAMWESLLIFFFF